MYCFARDLFHRRSRTAALVAAIAYIYAPYLITNVYIRGAIAEVAAQALLPWILWATRRLITAQRPQLYILPLAFILAALAISHNITLLLFPPFLILYILLVWWSHDRQTQRLLWVAGALLLAMALSVFFWLPLLGERSYLADTAYSLSRSVWLPEAVWTWRNFLDSHFFYQHSFERPIRIGVVETALAAPASLLRAAVTPNGGRFSLWLQSACR